MIEVVELESKLQCFLNPHKYSVQEQPNIIVNAIT